MKKNFLKLWSAGIFILIITYSLYTLPNYIPKDTVTYFVDLMPAWLVIILMSIAVGGIFVALPWVYGRLIKWIYEEYKLSDH